MRGTLNNNQINNILSSQSIGRIACSDGLFPYITPINYVFDGTYIYAQTNTGSKLEIMRVNPNVCFEVELITNMRSWQSVVAHGEFEELWDEDADEAWDLLSRIIFPLKTNIQVHNHEHEVSTEIEDESRVKHVMFRIRINKLEGRFQSE